MKQLLLMRHAKSDWGDSSLSDHDRPLNARGERDAPRMGVLLEIRQCTPDLILASTARRARDTARLVAQGCGYTPQIVHQPSLYHATVTAWEEAVSVLPAAARRVLMVGHNPGIEQFQQLLTGRLEPFPTATIALLRLDADDWQEFRSLGMSLEEIWRPKEL